MNIFLCNACNTDIPIIIIIIINIYYYYDDDDDDDDDDVQLENGLAGLSWIYFF